MRHEKGHEEPYCFLKSSRPRSAEEAWKRACPPTLKTGRHCPLCTCASSSIPRPEFSYTHIYRQVWPCTLMTICGATLPHSSHYNEEACDNAVIYFIAPSLRLVWCGCPSVRACPFTSVVKSCHREDWVFVNKPHCLHTHHMYVPVPPLSPWRDVATCQMSFSFKPYMGFFGFQVLGLWAELKCLWISHWNCFYKNIHINAWLPPPNIYMEPFVKSYYHCACSPVIVYSV